MASAGYSFKDLAHPNYQNDLRVHNVGILKLVKTVAEFAQKISLAHEDFSNQVQQVVETFKKKNQELKSDRGPLHISQKRYNNAGRPPEFQSSLAVAWETLLQETQYDAQAHSDAATLLIKNVYTPLAEISGYKKSQTKKILNFRENIENILATSEDNVIALQKTYIESYQSYRSNLTSRDAGHCTNLYHNEHNDYILQIRASNRQEEEYHNSILPYLLQELEEINIDVCNTLNGSLESHALLLLTKANEQSRRFDTILHVCKQVHPKADIDSYLSSVCRTEPLQVYQPRKYRFIPPNDPSIPGSELGTLKGSIVNDKYTEPVIQAKRAQLQKEAAELTSYLKQNQDITKTLINVCQRNLANHLYAKVYETQEDLCRKRNDIRMANLQLAAIRAQIEALQHKQNGSAIEPDQESNASSKTSKASIKGMWKKAVKSLKTTKEPKESRDLKEREKREPSVKEKRDQPSIKERERLHSENADKMEDKPKYSRMVCFFSLDNSPPPSPSPSNHSPRQQNSSPCITPTTPRTPSTPKRTISASSFQSLLSRNQGIGGIPPQIYADWQQSSRPSSQKKGFFRKDSKDSPTAEEAEGPIDQSEIDPVYSLLKCAADMPRSSQPGVPGNKHAHGCCLRTNQSNNDLGAISTNTGRNNSRSSSPSSVGGCSQKCLQDANLRNTVIKGLYSGRVVSSASSLSGSVPTVMVDAKHIARDSPTHWDSNQRLLMEVDSVCASKRRVHFKTERPKSKSLETPYHHTHEQQKLNIDREDIQERSCSYSVIPQVAGKRQIPYATEVYYYYLQPNRNQSRFIETDPNRLSYAHAERMLRFRQRSFSADDLSPSSVEHEKWEREAHGDQIWKDHIKYNQDNSSGSGTSNKLEVGPLRHGRAPMLSTPQRSFSAGDISPSCEKWENETSERKAAKLEASCRNARITFMRDKLNAVQSSYPIDIRTGQPGHSWGEIMSQLPSGRHTIEKTKQEIREATLKDSNYNNKVPKQKVNESQEPEHRTRHKDKDNKAETSDKRPQSKTTRSTGMTLAKLPEKVEIDSSVYHTGSSSAFAKYRSYTLLEKKQHGELHKETAGRRISAPVTRMTSGAGKERRDSKTTKVTLVRQKDVDGSPSLRTTTQKSGVSRVTSKKTTDSSSPGPDKKGHTSRKLDGHDAGKSSRDSQAHQKDSTNRRLKSGAIQKSGANRSTKKRGDPPEHRENAIERARDHSPNSQKSVATSLYSSSEHSICTRTISTQVPAPRGDIYRDRSPGAYSHASSVPSQPTYSRDSRPIMHDSSLPVNVGRDIRRETSSSFIHQSSVQPDTSPKHVRVRRPRTLVRQKEINAHIRPMDYRGTQEHIKAKRQLMLEQRKSHSFESSFEDHFFLDLKYNGVDVKELKGSGAHLNNRESDTLKSDVHAQDAATKRLIMVRDRKERKSNSLDSSFEVVNENEVFYDAPSSFIQDGEKSPKNDSSARQKRLHQFKEQKSYSYECPTAMDKFHTKTHVRVEDLRNSDACFTRPRRELPVEPGSPNRRRSSGSPRSPQSRGSPHSPRSPSGRGSPHSPRSTSGRGSPRSPQGGMSPHSPRSPIHFTPHSPKSHQRKVSPKSSLSCSKDSVGQSRERSPSLSQPSRDKTYGRERYPSGEGQTKDRSPSTSQTQSRERIHVSPHSSREQSLHHSREQSLNEVGPRYRSPYSSRESSSREASLNKSKGSISQSRDQQSIRHSRDKSPYQSHEQSLTGSREYIAHRQFRDISPRGSNEQSLSLSRDVSPRTSRDRLSHSRESNYQSKEYIARSREHSPYHSRDVSPYHSQSEMTRSSKSIELLQRGKDSNSHDSIKASCSGRRECFQQQKSYSIDLPPSHDPYVEQERQVVEQNVSYLTSVRYEGLAPLKEYRESVDSHDEKSLQGYPSPITQRKDKSPRGNRRQQFTQQKSYSLDLPCIVREPVYSESEPSESKSKRVAQSNVSTDSPPPKKELLQPQTSESRRLHLLKQKSKSIDVPYHPSEAKEYLAKILERRSYDHAYKREYSKDFDAQLKRVMMARRAMTIDPHLEDKQPVSVQSLVPKAHKMRTFREQKSYSIDVPDKSKYEPEYNVRRERSPSQGQAQRPVVTFREPRSNTSQTNDTLVPNNPEGSSGGAVPKLVPTEPNLQKQKRNLLKQQKSYSLDIPISQVQRPTCEVRAADSGIGGSSDRTFDLIPDIHIEPNILVLDPESPPQQLAIYTDQLNGTGKQTSQTKRLEQYGKQKSYSIDVPPSVGHYYDQYYPESFECDFSQDINHLNVNSTWRQKRQDYFQHQKSYSVDVPSAEIGNSVPEYKLPERKVESDSKIQIRLPEKRPTHKRLQFLRYLTEQGTFSFDDGGMPMTSFDLPTIKQSDSSRNKPSNTGSNGSISSQEKLAVSQSSLSSNSAQNANKIRRKSLFALHNMKALADIPHSGESGESSGMGLADETTVLLCDSGVVFDEPLTKEVTIASVSTDKIAQCDNNDVAFASSSSSSNAEGCSSHNSSAIPTTESNTELKGILKNKDDRLYIREKDRESSWKWKLFACAEFLADRRAENSSRAVVLGSPLDVVKLFDTNSVVVDDDGTNEKTSPLSPLSEELRRYVLYDSHGEYSHHSDSFSNMWFYSGKKSLTHTSGNTRSPGSRRRKRLTHNMKSFSVDCSDSSKHFVEDKGSQKKSTSSLVQPSNTSGSSLPASPSPGVRSTFSLTRLLQSFVGTSSSGNTVQTKRSRFFGNRQASSLDTATDVFDNHTGSSIPPRSGSKPRSGSASESTSNSPKVPRRVLGNVFVALFNYKPREKDDLEIKAGSRVITLDTSNPDWWKGKIGGRIGYFPSNYVTKLNPGDRAMQVVSGLEIMEGEESIKLLKDQIVIQEGMAEDGMVMLRTVDSKKIPCPTKYLTDVEISK